MGSYQEEMAKGIRRIVTGIKDNGESTIIIDGPPAEVFESGSTGLYELWSDAGEPMARRDTTDRAKGAVVLEPPKNGIRVRGFSTQGFPIGMSEEEKRKSWDEAFTEMSGDGSRVALEKHPGMHETKTIDIVVILKGQIKLILEDGERILGPGDVVVQRGTNHAWEGVGDEPVLAIGVLVDREFAD